MTRFSVGVLSVALLGSGCGGTVVTGDTRHESTAIELEKADLVRVNLRMGAGELTVKSGTPKLVEADFTYNVPDWKPEVVYKPGELSISQPKGGSSSGNTENEWSLKLTNQIPLDVVVSLGAGEATMTLGDMALRGVNVSVGAGELKLDLRGTPTHDYTVKIQGGVGEATIQLPRDVGISASVVGGIGEISTSGLEKRGDVWVNPDRIGAPVTITLDVKGGIGEIHLRRE